MWPHETLKSKRVGHILVIERQNLIYLNSEKVIEQKKEEETKALKWPTEL